MLCVSKKLGRSARIYGVDARFRLVIARLSRLMLDIGWTVLVFYGVRCSISLGPHSILTLHTYIKGGYDGL